MSTLAFEVSENARPAGRTLDVTCASMSLTRYRSDGCFDFRFGPRFWGLSAACFLYSSSRSWITECGTDSTRSSSDLKRCTQPTFQVGTS